MRESTEFGAGCWRRSRGGTAPRVVFAVLCASWLMLSGSVRPATPDAGAGDLAASHQQGAVTTGGRLAVDTDAPGVLRRLYDWTVSWARTPYALVALVLVAFTEAAFFPVPPDVLLIAMALGAPDKALLYAAACTGSSVLGGVLGYGIGAFLFESVGSWIIRVFRAQRAYNRLSKGFASHSFMYIFAAALTPIPYKVFTIAAGACRIHMRALVVASVAGRGLRFFSVAALFMLFGASIERFIDRYFNVLTVALLALLVLAFIFAKITSKRRKRPAPARP